MKYVWIKAVSETGLIQDNFLNVKMLAHFLCNVIMLYSIANSIAESFVLCALRSMVFIVCSQ